ncbi:hypothetical protein [Staphylococcus capitis]|uniref:Uncharacterized protein n=1 Tax=Staphylococcus capitis TaxID=29388 RepID=A0ABX1SQ99_STACP|nr:hypothetical protein [Staphylococcus capitis]NMK53964.1 hypothetical protein [Staphylococcus capitis]NMK69343.1 hypothetical protein [Staphylococcus capitis]
MEFIDNIKRFFSHITGDVNNWFHHAINDPNMMYVAFVGLFVFAGVYVLYNYSK